MKQSTIFSLRFSWLTYLIIAISCVFHLNFTLNASSTNAANTTASSTSTEVAAIDVFGEEYLEESASLTYDRMNGFPFLSHKWVNELEEDFFRRFSLLSDHDYSTHWDKIMATSFKMKNATTPISSIGFQRSTANIISKISKVHALRERGLPGTFFKVIDHTLANLAFQGRFLKKFRYREIPRLEDSFLDAKRSLLRLRHDLEIAFYWIKQSQGTAVPELLKAKQAILPCVGRVFFIQFNGSNRVIVGNSTGTVVDFEGTKAIFTCRHFVEIDQDARLEIYYIPHKELDEMDYLPRIRITNDLDVVDWNKYQGYLVNKITMYNTIGMNSTFTFQDRNVEVRAENGPELVLTHPAIANIKKITDNNENNDIAFLEIAQPELLRQAATIDQEKFSSTNIWAAGYPGDGLSGNSFVVVGPSVSSLYYRAIDFNNEKVFDPNWHYRITSFPVAHGMSGGPVFSVKDGHPYVIANLQGADSDTLGTACSLAIGSRKLNIG